MDAATANDWQTRKVKNWLLAVLRFSLTLEGEDRADVMAERMRSIGLDSWPESRNFHSFYEPASNCVTPLKTWHTQADTRCCAVISRGLMILAFVAHSPPR